MQTALPFPTKNDLSYRFSPLTAQIEEVSEGEGDQYRYALTKDENARLKARRLPGLILAAVLTAPIKYFDPTRELHRSGSCSYMIELTLSSRRLSLREARELALRVSAEIERGLRDERFSEARFLAALWDEDVSG
jgi:hypothetical protein